MDIIVKAPFAATAEQIEQFLQRKWLWLHKQLTFFEKHQSKSYDKEYLSGEAFYYLGRQYKLLVQEGIYDTVSLTKGKLTIMTTDDVENSAHNKRLLDRWFRLRTSVVFKERYTEMLQNFNFDHEPTLSIRRMPKRWGSCVHGESIVLNPLLVQAHKDAIDYVIAHELCHVSFKKHDTHFYSLLERHVPEWRKTKEKLELLIG